MANEKTALVPQQHNGLILPQGWSFKIVNGVVHVFFGSMLFMAMMPQGAAAWVQSIAEGGFIKDSASVIGIGSHLGKFALLLSFSIKRFAPDQPSAYESIALRLTGNAQQSEPWGRKAAKYVVALAPGITFGLLTYITLNSFRDTVQKEQMTGVFQDLAGIADHPAFRHICALCSAIGNLVSAPGIQSGIYYTALRLVNNEDEFIRSAPKEKLKYYLGLGLGSVFTGVTTFGFENFYMLAKNSVEDYLDFPSPLAHGFGGAQLLFMWGLGFMASMGLGFKISGGLVDFCSNASRHQLTTAQIAATSISILLALTIVIPGGLPNVFQAVLENQNTFYAFMALFASAIAEAGGTYDLIKDYLISPFVNCVTSNRHIFNNRTALYQPVDENNNRQSREINAEKGNTKKDIGTRRLTRSSDNEN